MLILSLFEMSFRKMKPLNGVHQQGIIDSIEQTWLNQLAYAQQDSCGVIKMLLYFCYLRMYL